MRGGDAAAPSRDALLAAAARLRDEVSRRIVGQQSVLEEILIALVAGGHALLVGVPGLAKTLMVRSVAEAMHLEFRRIQFTPDLVPSDITGTEILEEDSATGARAFRFVRGPVFANVVLADEINRAPPRTQAALLEAMQEHSVTASGQTMRLPEPFFVLATQNPIEQEGTYPLPEAQVDRFMMKVFVNYPTKEQEMEVMRRISNMKFDYTVNQVLTKEDIFAIREQVNKVKISESLERYIIELVYATRKPREYKLDDQAQYIQFGASPRASINLNLSAKAMAYMEGRDYVLPEDIKEVALDVMNHRIILNYEAEADNVRTPDIIKALLTKVPISK